MQKDSRNSLLKKIYGQNIGLVQNSKPIMIENPEFLKLTQNGDDSSGQGVETESDILNSGNKVKEFKVRFVYNKSSFLRLPKVLSREAQQTNSLR